MQLTNAPCSVSQNPDLMAATPSSVHSQLVNGCASMHLVAIESSGRQVAPCMDSAHMASHSEARLQPSCVECEQIAAQGLSAATFAAAADGGAARSAGASVFSAALTGSMTAGACGAGSVVSVVAGAAASPATLLHP